MMAERSTTSPKRTVATEPQDHLPNRVCLLHQLVDRVVHELPRELDPFVDRRRGHPSGFKLLVKLVRVPRGDLVDPDSLGHVLFEVREIWNQRHKARIFR
jgi:hypothetical protein